MSACSTRGLTAPATVPPLRAYLDVPWLAEDDAGPADLDGLGGQRAGRGPGHDGAVLDAVLAAVARAVDGAVRDLADDAAHVRADGAEGLEVTRGRLGDDHLFRGEDLAAADRDLARGGQGAGRAPGARGGGRA